MHLGKPAFDETSKAKAAAAHDMTLVEHEVINPGPDAHITSALLTESGKPSDIASISSNLALTQLTVSLFSDTNSNGKLLQLSKGLTGIEEKDAFVDLTDQRRG